VVGPDYARPPVSLLKEWSLNDDETISVGQADFRTWWDAFNDQTLNRLIETAYHQNLSLQIAGVRVLQARAQLGLATGQFYPQQQQAFGTLRQNRLSEHSTLASAGGDLTYGQDEAGFAASWELDFWGKFRRTAQSADALVSSAIADYRSALVSLTADVARSYVTVRTLEKRLDIASQNSASQRESLRLAEIKFKEGTATWRDVEQARSLLNSTLATVPALEIQIRQAGNALSVLLGLPPSSLVEIVGGPSAIPTPPGRIAVGIPSDLLRRRPDVRGAEYQAIAQAAQIGVAKADLFPAFSLNGTFSFLSTTVTGSGLADIFSWNSRTYAVGPSGQWSLFNYGRLSSNVRIQDARFQELLLAYQNLVLTAQREVEDGLIAYLRSQERAELLAQSAESGKLALDLAIRQYQGGLVDFTTVTVAQQALLQEQDGLAIALGDRANSLVQVYRALGGGWEIMNNTEFLPDSVKRVMASRTNWGDLLRFPAYLPQRLDNEERAQRTGR
jgi:NodT family efflux transporter outer membrane factor (OMF) lipoprotein